MPANLLRGRVVTSANRPSRRSFPFERRGGRPLPAHRTAYAAFVASLEK